MIERDVVEAWVAGEPFVQTLRSNPLRRQWPTGLPSGFERRAEEASFGLTRPKQLDEWLVVTEAGHPLYREAHAYAVDDAIDGAMRSVGLAPSDRSTISPSRSDVTVVCVTKRPHLIREVLRNFDRQVHERRKMIIVTNSSGFDAEVIAQHIGDRPNVVTVHADEQMSLGACLNLGIGFVDTRFVAKFDDDDIYGPSYLHDALLAHSYAGAGVVGKHSYFAHLRMSDETVLRFPGQEFTYSSYLVGGTLVIDLDRVGDLRFPAVSIGEDQAFIRACHRRGISTFAADRFNFVQVRATDNTWQIPTDDFLRSTLSIGAGLAADHVER